MTTCHLKPIIKLMSLIKLKTNSTYELNPNTEFIIVGWLVDANLNEPTDNRKVFLFDKSYDDVGKEIADIPLKDNRLNKWLTLKRYDYNEIENKYYNSDGHYLEWTQPNGTFLLRTQPISENVDFLLFVKDISEPKNKVVFEKIVFNPNHEKCTRTYVYHPGMPNVVPYDDVNGESINKILQWRRTDAFGQMCVKTLTTAEMDESATKFCEANKDSLDCKCINRNVDSEYLENKKKYNSISDYCWYYPCASGIYLSNEFSKEHYCGDNIKKCVVNYIGDSYTAKNDSLKSPNVITCVSAYYDLPDIASTVNLPNTTHNILFPKIPDDVDDSPPDNIIKRDPQTVDKPKNVFKSFIELYHNRLIFFSLCITLLVLLSIK